MARWMTLTCILVTLMGCGQDKSVKKGTSEGIKIEAPTVVSKGGSVPEISKYKTGVAGKSDAGKSGK